MQITRGITGIWQISQNKNVSNAVPLKIRFFIPPTAYGMYHLPLSYSVQDFETYTGVTSGGSNHEHTVTIPNHSHSVTTTNHSHSVTTSNHSHSVTTSNHSHNITMWDYTDTQDCYLVGMQDRAGNYTLSQAAGGPANIIDDSGGGEVVSSASGGSEVVSSASGGGEVVSSASGGGTTPTSSVESTHTHTIEASMGTTPADCNDITVSVDGVDKTSELEAKYGTLPVTDAQDLDLFEYLSEPILNAWHEVIITPNGVNTPAGMCYIYAYLSPETVVKEV